jgi:hypothetical protein
VLFLLYPALWAVSTVASLVWRVKIDADERRL